MFTGESNVAIGYVVGLVFVGLFVLIGLVVVAAGLVVRRRVIADAANDVQWEPDTMASTAAAVGGFALIAVTVGLLFAFAWPPFDMQYHQYRQVTGTVQTIDARMITADDAKGPSQSYAVRYAESGDFFRCDDTRCAGVHPGDTLTLWCIRTWQQSSTPGYECNFGDTTPRKG